MANKLREDWSNLWKKDNLGNTLGSFGAGTLGALSAFRQNAQIEDTAEEEAIINSVENTQFGSGSYDNLASSFGVANMAKTNYTAKDLRGLTGGQILGNTLMNMAQGAIGGEGIWDRVINAGTTGILGLTGAFIGNKKARKKADELNRKAELANNQYLANFSNAASNTHNIMFNNTLLNMAAKGGRIYIKPSHRGRLTELKKRTGKTEAELYNDGNPAHKKMVVFARNARKWHHSLGGNLFDNGGLMHQHGGTFSNGVTFIGNGGTHEQNPFEGVQIGVDNQGIPNMVEEGEVIWQDYVFSNRLKVPNENITFADKAKYLQKESEERPNDPISRRGVEDALTKLMISQEEVRELESTNNSNNMFDKGGKKNSKSKSDTLDTSSMINFISEHDYYVNQLGYKSVEEGKRLEKKYKVQKTIDDISGGNNPLTLEDIFSLFRNNKKYQTGRNRNNKYADGSWLRYAPVVGSALGVFSDLIGTTNKPDYSNINLIQDATNRITPVGYTPIGTYLSYNPFDKNYYSNKLSEQAGATRRAIANQAINPGAAMAGLLTADYNAQTQLGGLFRQAEEYNQAQRERVVGFNRQTDAMNAEMAMKTGIANKSADELRLRSAITQAQMREQADATASAARSANRSKLFTNLGNVGIDIMNRADRDMLIKSGVFGTLSQKPTDWSDDKWKLYQEAISMKACGGKINRKKVKKGLTY